MILFFYVGSLVALAALVIFFMLSLKPLQIAARLPSENIAFIVFKSFFYNVLNAHPQRAIAEATAIFGVRGLSEREFLIQMCFIPGGFLLLSSFFLQPYLPIAPQILLILGAVAFSYKPVRPLATYLLILGIVFLLYPTIQRQAAQTQFIFMQWPALMWVMDRSWVTALLAFLLGLVWGRLNPWAGLGMLVVFPLSQVSLLSVAFVVFFLVGDYIGFWLKNLLLVQHKGKASIRARFFLALFSSLVFFLIYPLLQAVIPFGFELTGGFIFEAAFFLVAGYFFLDIICAMAFFHFWAKKEREESRESWITNFHLRHLGPKVKHRILKLAEERLGFVERTEADLGSEATQVFSAISTQLQKEKFELRRVIELTKV